MLDLKIAISLVDDEPTVTLIISRIISTFNVHNCILEYHNFKDFESKLDASVDLIFLDLDMGDGMSLEEKINIIDTKAPLAYIVILTGNSETKQILDAWSLGADGYIVKGVDDKKYLEIYCRRFYKKIKARHYLQRRLTTIPLHND